MTGSSQFRLLRVICEHGPISVTDAARKLGITPPSVSQMAIRLEDRGLALRQNHRLDLRRIDLVPTDAGRTLVAEDCEEPA
jgi:DNA-binding MarR family transcriptional regulator